MRREIEYVKLEYRPARFSPGGRTREFSLELKLAGRDTAYFQQMVDLDDIRSVYDILLEHMVNEMKHVLLSHEVGAEHVPLVPDPYRV